MSQNALIFLHISKTGGTTLRSIIEKQYLPETIYDIDPSYFVSNPDLYQEVITERIGKLEAMSDEEKGAFVVFSIPHPTVFMKYFHKLQDMSPCCVTQLTIIFRTSILPTIDQATVCTKKS